MRMGSASPVAEYRATSSQGSVETEWGRLRRPRRHAASRYGLRAAGGAGDRPPGAHAPGGFGAFTAAHAVGPGWPVRVGLRARTYGAPVGADSPVPVNSRCGY
ncbi:hypothetical protein GCM10010515_74150 [Streptomyces fructofermentans]|uniref:Uncharacterized protein n=1 Tax=Streptomyces fructofermentans TaxID=152141 RepID=A0A918U5E4_9ACTN|nr:hypothetical protein GCM10010515_74150 [Streptomyces fructofermentans]